MGFAEFKIKDGRLERTDKELKNDRDTHLESQDRAWLWESLCFWIMGPSACEKVSVFGHALSREVFLTALFSGEIQRVHLLPGCQNDIFR
ncbi:hypothetical protein BT93_C0200 [Corymbia citriodora subsp. variegata]|nr:hypothetical protein BT93_C0200 [Corymbia citriodora subsp. variegata]